MYKWNIDITLKGSGIVKHCVYRGPETLFGTVITKLFQDRGATDYVSIYSEDMTSVVCVCVGEIAAIDICQKEG